MSSSNQNNAEYMDKVIDSAQAASHVELETKTASGRPGIFLMGLCRSGKTSIRKVVFHNMPPNGTSLLHSTSQITKKDINKSGFLQVRIWDFPGRIDCSDVSFDAESAFGSCSTLIFVVDVQDDYVEALAKLIETVTKAHSVNPKINLEVFIHKVDEMSDDLIAESQRDIQEQVFGELTDAGLGELHLRFHLTSIFDHSIFEAFSKVVQKLIPQLPALENLLNIFIQNSGIEKAFLFDVVSKIYVATDSCPVDMHSFGLCCDMIELVMDLSQLCGAKDDPADAVFDEKSSSVIRMDNGMVLYLREVSPFLALVAIIREENFSHQGVIDYNFLCFREAVAQVLELGHK